MWGEKIMKKAIMFILFILAEVAMVYFGVKFFLNGKNIVGYVLIALAVILLIYVIANYNKLVKYKNKVKQSWSLIDIQLKLRFDLVPNLTRTIKKYCQHEQELIQEVTKIRKQAVEAVKEKDKIELSNQLVRGIKNMVAVSEAYPEVKADKMFSKFMQELVDIEDRIVAARRIYSSNVTEYNTMVESFPTSILAKVFGYKKEEVFQIETGEKININVGKELL